MFAPLESIKISILPKIFLILIIFFINLIFQKKIIINTENPLDLAKKILVEEHKYYPQIIENILNES